MNNVDAIILAGGLSRRMGAQNKLLLDWDGVPIIRKVVRTYLNAGIAQVTIVTGFEADLVQEALNDLPLHWCHNPAFEQGQNTTVAAGLRQSTDANATLIGLGDQPLLEPADLHALLSLHFGSDPHKISIPVDGDKRGNPVVLPNALRPRLLEDRAQPGCKRFIQMHSDFVQRQSLSAAGFYTDIDTPEIYAHHQGDRHEISH
ncbi:MULTISPECIES: nucleotidyltransferase family protein [Pacificibacter]|uniref:nucleotidyltransferase family protein n=1 Tax=Pacificibacter TaxID=1042323 RepID=UPI001C0A2EE0|nr:MULTISPECIES: nucleotidyltransferase family protein [Pacificibacter]MBU2936402.1 nucleotidyltransferase family protein [Pacificibacter marinus]MDO6616557.1 nucleotidyltransferase family protein [Pacificibacter sp. 1_MG-2023]